MSEQPRPLSERPFAIDCGATKTNPGRTKQAPSEEADINVIMSRWVSSGTIPPQNLGTPHYGDFTNVQSYQEAVNAVMQADELFNALPAELRDKMGNDAGNFIDYVADPANRDELLKLGLLLPVTGGETPVTDSVTPPTESPEVDNPDS